MPISKHQRSIFVVLLLSTLLCVWLSQHSINRYWQQSYHRPSPLLALNRFALWRAGGNVQNSVSHLYAQLREHISDIDQRILATQTPIHNLELALDTEALEQSIENHTPAIENIVSTQDKRLSSEQEMPINAQSALNDADNMLAHAHDTSAPVTAQIEAQTSSVQNRLSTNTVQIETAPSLSDQTNVPVAAQIEEAQSLSAQNHLSTNTAQIEAAPSLSAQTSASVAEQIGNHRTSAHQPLTIGAKDLTQSTPSQAPIQTHSAVTRITSAQNNVLANTVQTEAEQSPSAQTSASVAEQIENHRASAHQPLTIGAKDLTQSTSSQAPIQTHSAASGITSTQNHFSTNTAQTEAAQSLGAQNRLSTNTAQIEKAQSLSTQNHFSTNTAQTETAQSLSAQTSASVAALVENHRASAHQPLAIGAKDLTQSTPSQAPIQTDSAASGITSAQNNVLANTAQIEEAQSLSAQNHLSANTVQTETAQSSSAQTSASVAALVENHRVSAYQPLTIGAKDLTQSTSSQAPIQTHSATTGITSAQNRLSTNTAQTEAAQSSNAQTNVPVAAPIEAQSSSAQNHFSTNTAQTEIAQYPSAQTSASVTAQSENHRISAQVAAQGNASKSAVDLERVVLGAGDKVLLIGDSLMQGVAPFVQQTLQQHYGIHTINLSKQSTGLSYPDFFDWPAAVEKALAADGAIKALVVFLGPNDPWDFPDPQNDKAPYLKFKSKAWEAVYRSRIRRIVQSANAYGAEVIWLGIPFMKPEPLNSQMQYLDGVMRSEMRDKGIFVPTKYILTGGEPDYVESILLDGKSVRLRTKDGIHFTPSGQKQIAIAIMRRFQIN